jgi:2-alkyl-3-oxoalkanoate reductase
MRVAITGAAGFVGRATMKSAVRAGHDVLAIARASTAIEAPVAAADLRDEDQVRGLLEGVDSVIHLAAAKGGDFHAQYASTVKGSEPLLREALRAGVSRFILVSSFAVYDYHRIAAKTDVDETAPVDSQGTGRDAYAQTKALQEELAVQLLAGSKTRLIVARPGVVYGPGSWWTYRIGEMFGRLWVCFGSSAEVPMSYVDNCADALVHLATTRDDALKFDTYNVFEDTPTQRELRQTLQHAVHPRPWVVPIPWVAARIGVDAIAALNRQLGSRYRLPGFLVPESLAVRAKPLRYSNQRLLDSGWVPRVSLREGLDRAVAGEPESG